MRIPEFIGGLLVGFSFFAVMIGSFFLPEFAQDLPPANDYYELFLPWVAALIAGFGMGFGLRADEGGYGGFSFQGGLGEQWPTLVGGLGLAGAIGILVIMWLSGIPAIGIGISALSVALAVIGLVVTILNWELDMY